LKKDDNNLPSKHSTYASKYQFSSSSTSFRAQMPFTNAAAYHSRVIAHLRLQYNVLVANNAKLHKEIMARAVQSLQLSLDHAFDSQTAEFFPGTKVDLGFVVLRRWLNPNDIHQLAESSLSNLVFDPGDRGKSLVFSHKVQRIEETVYTKYTALWYKVMATIQLLDKEVWHALDNLSTHAEVQETHSRIVFPEMEYLTYDVEREGGLCDICPHTDNESVITIICMLSKSADFSGGESYFLSNTTDNRAHVCKLEQGDFVAFRGQ
jgi:hypothetical protein